MKFVSVYGFLVFMDVCTSVHVYFRWHVINPRIYVSANFCLLYVAYVIVKMLSYFSCGMLDIFLVSITVIMPIGGTLNLPLQGSFSQWAKFCNEHTIPTQVPLGRVGARPLFTWFRVEWQNLSSSCAPTVIVSSFLPCQHIIICLPELVYSHEHHRKPKNSQLHVHI